MKFRKIAYHLHLWPGLITGLFVSVIALTGAIYAFEVEIRNLTEPYRFVENDGIKQLDLSKLQVIAQNSLPQNTLRSLVLHKNERSFEAVFYDYDPKSYYIVYLNPFSGEVLKIKDMNNDFLRWIIVGHYYLWLPPQIGKAVVSYTTLIFLLILVSGFILWIPKTLKGLKSRLKFKWKSSWSKRNYNLHVVLGFYSIIFALVFAITGLVWGLQWCSNLWYNAWGGNKVTEYTTLNPNFDTDSVNTEPLNILFCDLVEKYPNFQSITFYPSLDISQLTAVQVNQKDGTRWKDDYRYYDPGTLKEVKLDNVYGEFKDANTADKVFRMNYDLHTGAILGLPGKVMASLTSLLIATFPFTGFFMWWKKKKKKKHKKHLKHSTFNKKE